MSCKNQLESKELPRYDMRRSYLDNYNAAPVPVSIDVPVVPGTWSFCGLAVDSPIGMPAGPLLNGAWCLYYASLGFDVLTYKTVRTSQRACYPVPNLVPVDCGYLKGGETRVSLSETMRNSWAVSFGMPSAAPEIWRADVEQTRDTLPAGKLLSVSVVGTIQPGWTLQDLADDYALGAQWAVESGADAIEVNFSCPNVSTRDGQLSQQPADAGLVADTIRDAIGSVPLVVKIGHVDPRSIEELVGALGSYVSAVAMTNNVAATVADPNGELLFDGQPRGICGNGCRQVSIAQTRLFRQAIERSKLNMEIVGVGGVFSADHVRQYMEAGASAVHVATAAMLNPLVAVEIKSQWTSQKPN